jgi:hypothetical protein
MSKSPRSGAACSTIKVCGLTRIKTSFLRNSDLIRYVLPMPYASLILPISIGGTTTQRLTRKGTPSLKTLQLRLIFRSCLRSRDW